VYRGMLDLQRGDARLLPRAGGIDVPGSLPRSTVALSLLVVSVSRLRATHMAEGPSDPMSRWGSVRGYISSGRRKEGKWLRKPRNK
jgi:hypothetical protein